MGNSHYSTILVCGQQKENELPEQIPHTRQVDFTAAMENRTIEKRCDIGSHIMMLGQSYWSLV